MRRLKKKTVFLDVDVASKRLYSRAPGPVKVAVKDCPNCGNTDTWRNGSDELQCDNCGHSEEDDNG